MINGYEIRIVLEEKSLQKNSVKACDLLVIIRKNEQGVFRYRGCDVTISL